MSFERSAPTIKDVARAAGVSMKTVSRVVNNERGVRTETGDRVRQIAAELGYSVNQAARHLVSGRTGSIGIVIYPTTQWQNTADLVSGALARARERGYGLVPYILQHYEADERETLLWLAGQKAVDGVVLTTPWTDNRTLHAELRGRGMPIVLLPAHGDTDQLAVRVDDEQGAYTLARHLIGLGHRSIAVIGGEPELDATIARWAGFARAMREAGLDPDAAPHVLEDHTFRSGLLAARAYFRRPERPTAILCFTDVLAAAAIRAAHEAGCSIPAEVSIVGMGDQVVAEIVWPPITTVSIPTLEMAARAVDLLLDSIQNVPGAAREAAFTTRLVKRRSDGPAPVRN